MSKWSLSEIWAGFFAGAKDAGIEIEAAAETVQAVEPEAERAGAASAPAAAAAGPQAERDGGAEVEALRARLATLEAERQASAQAQRETAAAAFADGLVREGKALPAERDQLVQLHTQAAAAGPELLASVEASYCARPAHTLTAETVPTGAPAGALPADPKPAGVLTAERRAALLSMSNLGRAVLAGERK